MLRGGASFCWKSKNRESRAAVVEEEDPWEKTAREGGEENTCLSFSLFGWHHHQHHQYDPGRKWVEGACELEGIFWRRV